MRPDCEETLREIERFLDGEMPVEERASMDGHLRDCSPCMDRADFKRHLKELIAASCGCDDVPADLRERVARLIAEAEHTPSD